MPRCTNGKGCTHWTRQSVGNNGRARLECARWTTALFCYCPVSVHQAVGGQFVGREQAMRIAGFDCVLLIVCDFDITCAFHYYLCFLLNVICLLDVLFSVVPALP